MNYPDFLNRIYSSALSPFSLSLVPQVILSPILVALMLGLFPVKASSQCNVSGDIPFIVFNSTDDDFCIKCTGPWFRASKLVQVKAEEKNCSFYAAKITIFSPFGEWNCKTYVLNPGSPCFLDAEIDNINFCTQPADPKEEEWLKPAGQVREVAVITTPAYLFVG
jgi:hypothetical protein